jgi:hypothetical protein
VTFDTGKAVEFLDLVLGDCASGRIGVCAIGNGPTRHAHFQWIYEAVQQAQAWDKLKPVGIYFRVTMLPPEGVKNGRGSADDAHALAFWWADVDFGGVGHKPDPNGLPLPPDEDAALQLIADLPTPSLLVHSGGGFYPIWRFEHPVIITDDNRAEAKARSQDWQNMIRVKAERRGWHYGSGVGDLARVLRLPGTVNRKEGLERPCGVVGQTGEVFPW